MIGTGHLGRILLAGGAPGAGDYLDQAVQLARAFAVRPLLSWWLDSLGELAELEGRYDDARSWYEQAAKGLQRFDQPQVVAGFELPGQRLMAAVDRRGPIPP